jgi:hypothetical protein
LPEDFFGVDSDIGADIKDGQVIDNNDYVSFSFNQVPSRVNPPPAPKVKPEEKISQGYPDIGDYILMINGKMTLTGSVAEVEKKVQSIIYGEDKDFSGNQVSPEDIIVLKRVSLKIGIFVNE